MCSCRYHYNLAQDAQIASSRSGEKNKFFCNFMKICECNISHVPVVQPVFFPLFLVFLQVAMPHTFLLLHGKAVVAGEVPDAVLGILEQVLPTDDSLPGR